MKNKKGLSAVVATLMLVLLSLVLVGILWGVIRNLIDPVVDDPCQPLFDKVKINNLYTCYDGTDKDLVFSLSVEDVDNLDGILVSISGGAQKKGIEITNASQTISGLAYYDGGTSVKIPGENSGNTYVYNLDGVGGITVKPDKIEIAPIIKDKQCDVSDSTTEIVYCGSIGL